MIVSIRRGRHDAQVKPYSINRNKLVLSGDKPGKLRKGRASKFFFDGAKDALQGNILFYE
jgi:hypothetical protein